MFRQLCTFRVHANPRLHILPAVVVLFLVFILLPNPYSSDVQLGRLFAVSTVQPRQAAANATLGFQRLIALSSKPSWRTRGLQAAAKLTGLDFTIPPQPHNPVEFVVAFEDIGLGQTTTPKHGSASAWVAHLDLLKFVIASGLETAFIVEDDVDWDVRIKDQIKLISDNVRNYTFVPKSDPTPYGADWDVLWLGHCGGAIEDWAPPGVIYADDTRIPTDSYASWSTGYLQQRLPEGHRMIHVSTTTVCSFGYGVTRASAQKILTLLGRGADEAFDVALSHHCRERELRCLVVNPQIMHHYEPSKDLGYVSPVDSGDGEGEPVDEAEFEFIKGKTFNIVESARCRALFNDTCA
ncbi:hypothetical protein A1O7_03617 [Cladophialophora yegresii CBS 114405]|uniref:Glycosyltransferase family 25 protein n=1 Tax=Cladophialophora yegresii CBS 114405 TaxID=1182544 RepID=W9WF20_9EURO|nr:uncharacterized protein A1O7_03617 [Cladophialophora yegresii CBS 114405]EXJ63171.1 hypothetical protein A1O7_03617 [Cladophialophora yegresii CBS 114405]